MGREDRALAARRGLARVSGAAPPDPVADAQTRLRAILDEIGRLDAEIEAVSAELADFSRRWERALSDVFQDLGAAERLVRRLQALEDGIAALAERLRSGAAAAQGDGREGRGGRRGASRRRPGARHAAREVTDDGRGDPSAADRDPAADARMGA